MKYIIEYNNYPQKIGVFDSGYGGLTILRELQTKIFGFDFVYFSDNRRAPYGNRSIDEIVYYTTKCVDFLVNHGCKIVLLACNTATVHVLEILKKKYGSLGIIIIGVVDPTIIEASKLTNTKKIGLLATKSTVESNCYVDKLSDLGIEVNQQACESWVSIIEDVNWSSTENTEIIKKDINNLILGNDEIDTIILGCTHFAIIENLIRSLIPSNINLINQSKVIGEYLSSIISTKGSFSVDTKYFTTEDNEEFDYEYQILFGDEVKSITVDF